MDSLQFTDGNIIRTPENEYIPEAGGMGKLFFDKMSNHGDAVAQIDYLTGERDTYKSLLQRCIRTAVSMRSRGMTRNDIISICSFNHLNSCVPFISSLFLGAKTASLDPTISLADTVLLLKQIHPKMVFVGPEAVTLIEDALRESGIKADIVVFGKSGEHLQFSEFLQPSDEEQHFKPLHVANLKDTAAIFFSSGTTGLPKGICVNHFSLLIQGFQLRYIGCDTSTILGFSSMYWISSTLLITCCIQHKGCRVIAPRYDPSIAWNIINELKVTFMFLAPSQAVALCKKGRPASVDIAHPSGILIGGGSFSEKQVSDLKEILPETAIITAYGQTELSGLCVVGQPILNGNVKLMEQKAACSGRPMPGFSYKIVDPETEEVLGPNQPGEIRVKSELQMNGYYGVDCSEVWDADGWLKTGDIGYYDEDHCFFIVDRLKEMLKFQSWHVPPAILENVLLTHPKVATAVVIGLPHPEDGDHPMALVTLKNSSADVNEDEIKQYVAERVDDRQRLRGGVKIINSIPVTPTGKIRRKHIRNMVLQGII